VGQVDHLAKQVHGAIRQLIGDTIDRARHLEQGRDPIEVGDPGVADLELHGWR
jgi:hypothetical protein